MKGAAAQLGLWGQPVGPASLGPPCVPGASLPSPRARHASAATSSFASTALPCEGLPLEEQRLLDALAAIVGPEYVCTISLVDAHKIADTTRRAIRDHFQRSLRDGAPVGPDPLDSLDQSIAAVLVPSAAPPPPKSPGGGVARGHAVPVLAGLSAESAWTMESAVREMRALEADFSGSTGEEWVVFLSPPDREAPPVRVQATSRFDAEYQVSRATCVAEPECFAAPARLLPADVGVPLAEHPLRPAEVPPEDLADAFGAAMQREIRRSEEGMAATMRATAKLLGCTVPELEATMAAEKAERDADQAARKAESKARRVPPPKNAPTRSKAPGEGASVADGLRHLTERQVELLRLVEVDQKTNRVVYTRDEHVADWSALKQAVEALGGRWLGKTKKTRGGWAFSDEVDAMDAISTALATGGIFDAKLLGFFATADWLADDLVARLDIRPGDRVLEPQAGKGGLALAIRRACPEAEVVCVELVPEHQEELRQLGFHVIGGDFLKLGYDHFDRTFQVVCMNPPFGKGRPELKHLKHGLDLLGRGGRLGAIMPSSLQFRGDAATVALRGEIEAHGAIITTNPPDAFRASGAMVKTVSLSLTKT